MIDWREILLTLVGAIIFALMIVTFASCSPAKVVTVVERHDSIVWQLKTDSVMVYARDSVYVREKGDTVFVDRWHTLWRDRIRQDTVWCQTAEVKPVVTEVERPVRYIPVWVWWLVGANVLLACWWAVKLYIKFKPI